MPDPYRAFRNGPWTRDGSGPHRGITGQVPVGHPVRAGTRVKDFHMRVFVTGATGFVGSAVVQELLGAGHQVIGLARSDKGAAAVGAAGAEVFRGSLEDTDGLKRAAGNADGVIHTGYIHDFSATANPAAAAAVDGRTIAAFGEALAGTG